MSESTKLDPASDSVSFASLKEANDRRIVRDEGEMAAAGDLEAARERSIEEKESEVDGEVDPYLVSWKGADDPENPLDFPMRKKVSLMVMIAAIAFLTPTGSAMFSPAIPNVMAEFHTTSAVLGSFSVSMFILGYAIGPLFLAPLSELYGRAPIIHAGNIFFTVFQIGCAEANSMATLIVLRLFAGIGGSAVLSVGGGVIADAFPKEKMGGATAAFSLGPLLGPVVGPVMYSPQILETADGSGGFVTQALGWRWCFWLLTIAGGFLTIAAYFLIPETNPHILLQRRAKKIRKDTGDEKYYANKGIKETPTQLLLRSLVRPMKLLIFSPIVLSLAISLGIIFGYVYLLFTTFPETYGSVYHWSEGIIGLSYLGSGIGFFVGLIIVGTTNDRLVNRLTKKNGGVRKPEYRMSVMMFFAPLIAIGMFWYGWAAEAHTHWIVPILGTVPIGIGMMGFFLPSFIYVIEAFGFYAASAIASLTFFRSLLGTFLPLAGPPLYAALGLGWGNSVLGFIAIVLIPVPFLLYRYGEWLRTAHPVNLD